VFSSDLSRAYDTAAHIIWSSENIISTPLLRGRNYYEFEWVHGSILDQCAIDEWSPSTIHFVEQWGNRSTWRIVESNHEIIQRREQFHREHIIPQHSQAILITSHWSFIRSIIAHILQLDLSVGWMNHYMSPLQNTWICIIEYIPEKWVRLVTYNQHTHILNIQ
jgi:broad specificity phosphatase PhoE